MGNIKQTNFRINQQTADAFRKFCEEQGMNQAQGFDHVMQIVEMDAAKSVVPERRLEIESFEKNLKDILAAYLLSIDINKNSEERIAEQFKSKIFSQEQTITFLRKENAQLKSASDLAEKKLLEAEKMMEAAKEREKLNSMLADQLQVSQKKIEDYDNLVSKLKDLEQEKANFELKLENELNKKTRKIELENAKLIAQIELLKNN